jgi:anthranilate synthase component 1
MSVAIQTHIQLEHRRKPADLLTPVSIYLKLRDHFPQAALLESNDFRAAENCFSFIGLEPLASFIAYGKQLTITLPEGVQIKQEVASSREVPAYFQDFLQGMEVDTLPSVPMSDALFGFQSFESVQYFDAHPAVDQPDQTPDLHYTLYRYLIAINHFTEEMTLIERRTSEMPSGLDRLEQLLDQEGVAVHPFQLKGDISSPLSDDQFAEMVEKGIAHCRRGDVFQLVLARRFQQEYRGDDFNLYRALRSINPSPYLFYFDFGNYRIMGSSPESQLVVEGQTARLNPIAGTYKRTGDETYDQQQALALAADPKENAEHTMLVDLARNDLSRFAHQVEVKALKEIHQYSHVIHLVSTVEGKLPERVAPFTLMGATFPAGTLSGAPKFKAVELIRRYEPHPRGYYGGAIGLVSPQGNVNQAILIRSFLSRGNHLFFQAGAGIVVDSDPQRETQEVHHKLQALQQALQKAQTL